MFSKNQLIVGVFVAVVAGIAGFALGHRGAGKSWVDLAPAQGGAAVATFRGGRITADEVAARLAEMPPTSRARYQTLEQRREYVDGLARFDLLVQEGVSKGLDRDPEVVETAKKVMVQRLLQRDLDEQAPEPSPEEIAEYYQRHLADYVKPEMFRLSHVFLAAAQGDTVALKQKKALAEKLLAQAKALPPADFKAFGAIVAQASEEPRTKPLEGDMRFLSAQELSSQYGPEVAEAAAKLQAEGELSGIVQTERGLHILKLRSRQPPTDLPLERARPQIVNRIKYERRTQRYASLLEDITAKYALAFDDAALSAIPVDAQAPAKPSRLPPPGFIPAPARPAAAPVSPPNAPPVRP